MTTLRMLRIELRHNAMALMLPVVIALFWLTTYRKTMALAPMWSLRATGLQSGSVTDFVAPLAGAAAWMGSRESRRRVTDTVTITPRAQWGRLFAIWAATTIWAMVAYLGCAAVLYGVTASQASWGGPLWWPAAVAAAGVPAFTALGFAAGVLLPSRLTAPLAAIVAFFLLALSTELIRGDHSYWQITPIVTGPWNLGPDPGAATFYRYLPDLPIAQMMFLAGSTTVLLGILALPTGAGGRSLRTAGAGLTAVGLAAAATAVMLAGTGMMNQHGMIDIPDLHDAASDQPTQFTPVCSHTAIPVCLNPAYARYVSVTAAALEPVLNEIAHLPGAPAQVLQEAVTYSQDHDGSTLRPAASRLGGSARVYHLVLPVQLPGPDMTAAQLTSELQGTAEPEFISSFTGDGAGASPAQDAVAAGLLKALGQHHLTEIQWPGHDGPATQLPGLTRGTAAFAAARRFASLSASVRRAWLAQHLAALRAGQITLGQLP